MPSESRHLRQRVRSVLRALEPQTGRGHYAGVDWMTRCGIPFYRDPKDPTRYIAVDTQEVLLRGDGSVRWTTDNLCEKCGPA